MIPVWVLFIVLVLQRFDNAQADEANQGVLYYRLNEVLRVKVILINVPKGVDNYELTYMDDVPLREGPIQENKPIEFTQRLTKETFRIYIKLRKGQRTCISDIVIGGLSVPEGNTVLNNSLTKCKNLQVPCEIHRDFHYRCENHSPAGIDCQFQNAHLTCYPVYDDSLPPDITHHWYQSLSNARIPEVTAKNTQLKMQVYAFDVGTTIYNIMTSPNLRDNLETREYYIDSSLASFRDDFTIHTESYSESKPVQFDCDKYNDSSYKNLKIGIISKNGNIQMLEPNKRIHHFTIHDSGKKLCCILYYISGNKKLMIIQRYVMDMTVIKYTRSLEQNKTNTPIGSYQPKGNPMDNIQPSTTNNVVTTGKNLKYTTTKTTNKPSYLSTTPKNTENLTIIHTTTMKNIDAVEKLTNNNSTNTVENFVTPPTDKTKYYYGFAAVVVLVLLVFVYVAIKKLYRKSSVPQQELELETYGTSNLMLYAELNLNAPNTARPVRNDEETYAEIIGVLEPDAQR